MERSEPWTASAPRCRDSWQAREPGRPRGRPSPSTGLGTQDRRCARCGPAPPRGTGWRPGEGSQACQQALTGGQCHWVSPGPWSEEGGLGALSMARRVAQAETGLTHPPQKSSLTSRKCSPWGRMLPGSGAGRPPQRGAVLPGAVPGRTPPHGAHSEACCPTAGCSRQRELGVQVPTGGSPGPQRSG